MCVFQVISHWASDFASTKYATNTPFLCISNLIHSMMIFPY